MYEEILLNMDFIHLAQFLTRLPDFMSAHRLFRHIEAINMNIDKRRFGQVLALHKEIYTQKEQDKNDTWWKHSTETVWFHKKVKTWIRESCVPKHKIVCIQGVH